MTPWRDCAPCHSQPDGARLPLTRHPAYGTSPPTRANSVREGHSLPTACRIPPAMAARPPSSCRCGCLAPPSSPSIGIWLGPFAFPYPSSMVSTTRTSRFGGFGLRSAVICATRSIYFVVSARRAALRRMSNSTPLVPRIVPPPRGLPLLQHPPGGRSPLPSDHQRTELEQGLSVFRRSLRLGV